MLSNCLDIEKYKMAQPPPPPLDEGETPGCVVKEIEKQLYKTLKDVFKYDSYKSLVQKRAVEAVVTSCQDVFVSMPTGAGKSLCYQLPALVSERSGITIVVSPLIALMTNQMGQMKSLGIKTETINSKMPSAERERVKKDLNSNCPKTRLLYITPELANTLNFHTLLDHMFKSSNVARIVVDEAHCVSQWGHNFRPDYLRLGDLRTKYISVPWVALTATASVKVMDDVLALLRLSQPVAIFKTSCFRPNLFYDVVFKETISDPYSDLREFAVASLGEGWESAAPEKRGCGIVYCRTRDACEELSSKLSKLGLRTQPYHAGIKAGLREETQEGWMKGRIPVIAATVSFGMGIDKSSVRFVAHWCVSQSVAGYYQESGRAGRDGAQSKCRIYYSRKDRDTILFLLKNDETTAKYRPSRLKIAATIKSFNTMIKYCEESACRHYVLAREFGDDVPDCRKHCDVCVTPKQVDRKISLFKNSFLGSKICGKRDFGESSELYGGGRQGAQAEYDQYQGKDSTTREKEAATALSNLISDEFKKRRPTKERVSPPLRLSNCKVIQPKNTRIPEVSVSLREQYHEKLVAELKSHLKSCSSNKKCPVLKAEEIEHCAAEFEFNSYSLKGNIHMYRREIVNITKSLREASRQVEVHPVVANFIPNRAQIANQNSKIRRQERLSTIIDFFDKSKFNNENGCSSISCSDSHKTGGGSDNSIGDELPKNILSLSSGSIHCESEGSVKLSPSKANRHRKRTCIEEKPIIKKFLESVSSDDPVISISSSESEPPTAVTPPLPKPQKVPDLVIKPLSLSPVKKKRRKSFDLSDSEEKTKKSEPNKTTTQIRNDNLKKAADLVRKHLNPEYKSKRIGKDFFKIVCRSISHRLVESDSVNDTAAKYEVEKLLQSNGAFAAQ